MSYLLVYGSLIHPCEMQKKDYPISRPTPVWIDGYKRVFNQEPSWRPSTGMKRAVLSVTQEPGKRINAVIFHVDKQSNFSSLDDREKGYKRVEVQQNQVSCFLKKDIILFDKPIYIYKG